MYYELKKIIHYAFISAIVAISSFILVDRLLAPISPTRFTIIRFLSLGCLTFALLIYFRVKQKENNFRITKGTKLTTPKEFNRLIGGDGIGIPALIIPHWWQKLIGHTTKTEYLQIRSQEEAMHLLISGDSGTGKSALQHSLLLQIDKRNDSAIVYDPSIEFYEHHANSDTDILLHPFHKYCPYWNITDEINNQLDATALAKSFIPDSKEGQTIFWETAPRKLLSFLLLELKRQKLGTDELVKWLADGELINDLVAGTELESLIDRGANAQRAGVLGSLNLIADALKLLPPDDGRPHFSFTSWGKHRQGWIFIGTRGAGEREGLRPIISAWLDTAFSRLMTVKQGHPTWLFVDEMPSLQKLPSLKTALHEGRKYNMRFVLGFQGRAQLEALYGREAETLMSAPSTRIFLRSNEYAAAEWTAKNIGMPEREKDLESYTSTLGGQGRDSINHRTETKTDYLVYPNEIQNLEKLSGFLRYDKYAVPIRFPYPQLTKKNGLIEMS